MMMQVATFAKLKDKNR